MVTLFLLKFICTSALLAIGFAMGECLPCHLPLYFDVFSYSHYGIIKRFTPVFNLAFVAKSQ